MTDETNFFWLVGLLEGEGSFLRPSPSKPNEPKIDIEMRDEDVIRRVSALFGLRYRKRDRHRENTHVTFHVRLAGKKAVALMWRLRPYVSERRQQQIDRAIESFIARGIRYHPANLPAYAFRPVCMESLCAAGREENSLYCSAHHPTTDTAPTDALAA